jgi:exodeoxyribonuclease V
MITVKDLSFDQREAYDSIVKWIANKGPTPVLTLGGYAGTGKSTVTGIIGSLEALQPIAFVTYTGKASSVLRKKLGVRTRNFTCTEDRGDDQMSYCGTIHSLIYQPIIENGVVTEWELRTELDADYKLIVIDEASMVDDDMLIQLRGFGIPILAVGDHGQLPPVSGYGSLMDDPMLRLEKIHRQAEGNPIIALSKAIRETGRFDSKASEWITYGRLSDLNVYLAKRYTLKTDLNKLVTICYTNSRRVHTNAVTRSILKRPGPPTAKEQIVCLKNIKGTSIYNGMRGIIHTMNGRDEKFPWQMKANVDFVEDALLDQNVLMCVAQFGCDKTLDFERFAERLMQIAKKDIHVYSWSQVGHLFDFGYAMTAHKCQGSQFDDVLLTVERPSRVDEDGYRRWCYTAVTRASSHLTVLR